VSFNAFGLPAAAFRQSILVLSLLFQKSKLPYYDQIEMILVTYVFPDLTSEHGYLRAKVIYCMLYLAEDLWTVLLTSCVWRYPLVTYLNYYCPVSGANFWNRLPSHVTSAPSLAIFRQRL